MKVLLYGINFSPELTGVGKYTGEMAEWLSARGHEVRVVTAPPYYPDWKVGKGFRNWWGVKYALPRKFRNDHASGAVSSLVVYRCPLWVPERPGGLKRMVHLASFAFFSLPVMLQQVFWRPNVVWVVEPTLFSAPAALVVARLAGARVWLHVQDFEVDAAFALGMLRGALMRRLVAGVECWLMRRFDCVSTISRRMHQKLLDKGVAPSRAVLTPNWVDVSTMVHGSVHCHIEPGAIANNCDFRQMLGVSPGAVVALYSGTMGATQGLEVLADVARLCLDEAHSAIPPVQRQGNPSPIVFVFCGNGVGRADLEALCAGLSNVRFLDLQPPERLNALLAMADIHLLPQREDAADLVMPSKLGAMLASGRPVVVTASAGTELADVISGVHGSVELRVNGESTSCGILVGPGNALSFAHAVQRLAQNPELRIRLGSAGRAYAEAHLDREPVLQRFEALLMAGLGPSVSGGCNE
jgi:colanic acid biosynthesis glycosyl transferase WcaI